MVLDGKKLPDDTKIDIKIEEPELIELEKSK
jgi:hypothetical protein